ncbi:MAG TPA: GDSL-type esterase/lipase family protein [Alphaproteobacteria bacterium]|nr:GDSL-type esterase/lipase family protein [Alphaproteobacteria bacterium]
MISRGIRAAAAVLALLWLAQCAPAGLPPAEVAEERTALAPLFEALYALETGVRTEPVRILQLGDSHTAGDRFSGRLRARFQDRFGDAGRGMLPPGVPFDYYAPTGVGVRQTGDWTVAGGLKPDGGLLGLSGFRLHSNDPAASIELTSDTGFDRASLEIVRRPGGGTLAVRIDGGPERRVPGGAPVVEARTIVLDVPFGSRLLTVRPLGDGPVAILSWTVERARPGVVLDSHGVVGATAGIGGRWDEATIAAELAGRRPDLIILAYGTNEGFDDTLDAEAYGARFAGRLRALEAAAPGAAILVVGPPDANRLPRACRSQEREGRSFACVPLNEEERATYASLLNAGVGGPLCRWHPPPNLRTVRRAQRAVAEAEGHAFWDWNLAMGGACSIDRWTHTEPPLAWNDHVHLRPMGYEDSADALFDRLMAGYERWRSARAPGS